MTPTLPLPKSTGFWSRLVRGRRTVHCSADWPAFAGPGWESRVMSESVPDREHVKQGRRIGRWTLTSDTGTSLVAFLKRHYVLPRWHGLLATLFPNRAWSPGLQEWQHLAWAESQGIPVPRTLAVAEFVGPWGKLQGFLATEELHDMLPLHEAIPHAFERLPPENFARWKRGLIAEIARLSRELHCRSAYHKDLYLCHFYIAASDTAVTPDDWRGRAVMIDFHRLGHHRHGREWYRIKDLAQLLYSTDGVAGITDRDRLRFWKLYRSGDWGLARPPRVWIRTASRWKYRTYARHAARKLARKERTE